jgi:[acyl-carrier-protein] S-malonyltransferase
MGADLALHFGESRACFERASKVLEYDLLELCSQGSDEQLRDTRVSQPAIFTTNVAIYRAIESLGLKPVVSGGHSFGEYCSLTIAGSLSFEDAVRLVNERGLAMGESADLAPGTMAAIIGFEESQIADLCSAARAATGELADIANLNSPLQIVVSGGVRAVNEVCAQAKKAGAKRVVPLNVSGAWHSELMRGAVNRLAPKVEAVALTLPSFSVISNVEAAPYTDVRQIRRCLVAGLCERVRWHETALLIAAHRPDMIVECGATAVLAPMMRRLPDVVAERVLHVADSSTIGRLALLVGALPGRTA